MHLSGGSFHQHDDAIAYSYAAYHPWKPEFTYLGFLHLTDASVNDVWVAYATKVQAIISLFLGKQGAYKQMKK